MERQDSSLTGVPGEQTTGLPAWKRVLDLVLIVAMCPGLLILGAGVALVVMCGSRGPVLFRQRRVGYKGREFDLLTNSGRCRWTRRPIRIGTTSGS